MQLADLFFLSPPTLWEPGFILVPFHRELPCQFKPGDEAADGASCAIRLWVSMICNISRHSGFSSVLISAWWYSPFPASAPKTWVGDRAFEDIAMTDADSY